MPVGRSICWLFILSFLCVLFPCRFESQSDVLVLTSENFDEVLQENDYVFVEFYAPWCGHCKALAPTYEKVATAFKGKIIVGKVDATQEAALADRYHIEGYPTLLLLGPDGSTVNYSGGRTLEAIISWIQKKSGPSTTILKSIEEIQNFISTPSAVVYFGNDQTIQTNFRKAGATVEDLRFGEVSSPQLAKEVGATFETVKAYASDGSVAEITADSQLTQQKIKQWASFEAYPILRAITPDLFNRFVKDKSNFAMAFLNEDDKTEWLPVFEDVARALKNKIFITWASTKLYATALSRFGASGNVVPTIVGFSGTKDIKPYAWDEKTPLTKEGVIEWLNDLHQGKAKAFRKSQPIPQKQEEAVITVVGDSFESVVYDETKDVLLEIYATWCGHCKSLVPIYSKLGKVMESVNSVVIAKLEGTENGYPESINVQGFPTIYLFPANAKQSPIVYQGDRTVQGFVDFIHQHASVPFEIPSLDDLESDKETSPEDQNEEDDPEDVEGDIPPEGEEIEGEEIFEDDGEGEFEGEGEVEGEEIFEDDDDQDKENIKDEL